MNKVVEYINKYKQENPSGWRKWIIGSVIAVLTLVVIAVFAFQAAMRGRELARLQHERDVAKEDLHQAQIDAQLAANKAEAANHNIAASAALARVVALEDEISVLEDEHNYNESLINSIRSWDDVDRLVK